MTAPRSAATSLAGIAVAAMIVPKDLGYAGIAGIPIQNGLYAAAAGAIVYALFCTSRHISTGPSSSLAAVAGGAVLVAGVGEGQAAELVAAITLVTGALFVLVALLRLGWVARFLSRAVVTGFLAGAAVDVVIGELPKITGTDASGETAWGELASWLRSLGDVSTTTVLVGVVALAVILALRFRAPQVPGALVLVVGGLLATPLFDLDAHGVALVGTVPGGPALAGPAERRRVPRPLRDDPRRGGRAAADRLLADRRRRAGVRRPPPLPRRRQPGVRRAGHGEPRGGRVPRDAGLDEPVGELAQRVGRRAHAARLAGHRRARGADAPRARPAVQRPAEGRPRRDHHRRGHLRDDRHPRAAAPAPRQALRLLGRGGRDRRRPLGRGAGRRRHRHRAVAAVAHLRHDDAADAAARARPGHPRLPRRASSTPATRRSPAYVVLRPEGGLFFATAEALEERVRALALDGDVPLRAVVLDMEGVDFVDSQGSATLAEILDFTDGAGVRLSLARVKPSVRSVLASDGVLDRLGADHVHDGINQALEAQLAADRVP